MKDFEKRWLAIKYDSYGGAPSTIELLIAGLIYVAVVIAGALFLGVHFR